MTKAALAFLMCSSLTPSAAFAVDWSINSTISQSVELNDNQFLKTMLAGGSLGSYTTLSANAVARTATSKFDFDSDGTYQKYWGAGVDGLPSEFTRYGFRGHYETYGKTAGDREFLDASFSQQSVALALLGDLGIQSNSNAALQRTTIGGGFDRSVTARDNVNVAARTVFANYDPSNAGIAFSDTLATAKWLHDLNSVTRLTSTSELEYLDYDNFFNTNVYIVRSLIGLDAALSPLLSFRGSIGWAYTKIDRSFATGIVAGASSTATSTSGSGTDLIANIAVSYKWLKDTTLSLDGGQTVSPSIVGSLLKRSTIRGGLNYLINYDSNIGFYSDFTRLVSSTSTDFVSASVVYSYRFTQSLTAQISYRYLHRTSTTGSALFDPITGTPTGVGLGPADSNSLLFVFSKSFVVLPPGF